MVSADTRNVTTYRKAFWIAVGITLAAWILPFGSFVIYPFSLLAVWAHELGHGLAALIAGGAFHHLVISPGLGGVAATTSHSALASAMVALGGLIGAPLLGAIVTYVGWRSGRSRAILTALAACMVLSVIVWVRNLFGIVSLSLLAVGLGLLALRGAEKQRFVVVQLIGIQLGLSAMRGLDYLFSSQAKVGGLVLPSDVSAIAGAIGGPFWVWGALIAGINLGLLYLAYRLSVRRLRQT
jgi:hypothetical protein